MWHQFDGSNFIFLHINLFYYKGFSTKVRQRVRKKSTIFRRKKCKVQKYDHGMHNYAVFRRVNHTFLKKW